MLEMSRHPRYDSFLMQARIVPLRNGVLVMTASSVQVQGGVILLRSTFSVPWNLVLVLHLTVKVASKRRNEVFRPLRCCAFDRLLRPVRVFTEITASSMVFGGVRW
jgi:hypothetical protein